MAHQTRKVRIPELHLTTKLRVVGTKYINTRVFFIAVLLCTCTYVVAQQPLYSSITTTQGLPTNTVYSVYQDANGYIWFGHDKGLSRYDGTTFLHISSPSKQGRSLSNIFEINGLLHCQDFYGNYYTLQENQTLQQYSALEPIGVFLMGGVSKGNRFVAPTRNSIRVVESNKGKVQRSISMPSMVTAVSYCDSSVFLHTIDGVYLYERGDAIQKLQTLVTNTQYIIRSNTQLFAIRKSALPTIENLTTGKEVLIKLPKGAMVQMVQKIGNQIWIGTTNGAYCFNEQFEPLFNGLCFFPTSSVSSIIRDREGNYWFASINKGVFFVPDLQVVLFDSFGGVNNLLQVPTKDESAQLLLAGTAENSILEFKGDCIKQIVQEKSNHEVVAMHYNPNNGILFLASNALYVYAYNRLTNKIQLITQFPIAAKSIVKINDWIYAVAFSFGVYILDVRDIMPTRKEFGTMSIPAWLQTSKTIHKGLYHVPIESGRTRCVFYGESDSSLYVAGGKGFFILSPKGIANPTLNNSPLYVSSMQSIGADVLASTFQEGLLEFTNSNLIHHFSRFTRIKIDEFFRLQVHKSNLWVLGENSLFKFDLPLASSKQNYPNKPSQVLHFSTLDLRDFIVNDSQIVVATSSGLLRIQHSSIRRNTIPPLLHLNTMYINSKPVRYYENMEVEHNQNTVEIHFACLSYKNSKSQIIKYSINNSDWHSLSSGTNNLRFSMMSPGSYTVVINAWNEDGVQSQKPITLSFTILKPIYQRWWFIGSGIAIFFIVVYVAYSTQVKNIKKADELATKKIQLEYELQKSLLTSIKSQMNPHFLFNALNTIQSYIYTNEKENASLYLSKFSTLTRMILSMSNKEHVSLTEEFDALLLYIELENIRLDNQLHYTVTTHPSINADTTHIPSMLIQPYVENAIKHGLLHKKGEKKLEIYTNPYSEGIEITIIDSGIGRRASEALRANKPSTHQSFASNANKTRLEILNAGSNADISLQIIDRYHETSGIATGTTVVLRIPTTYRNTV